MPPKFAVIRHHNQNLRTFACITFDFEEEGLSTNRVLTEMVTPDHNPFSSILQAMEIAWRVEECQRVFIAPECARYAMGGDYEAYLLKDGERIPGLDGDGESAVSEPAPEAHTCLVCGVLVVPAASVAHNTWHVDLQRLLQFIDGFNTEHDARIALFNENRIQQ